MRSLLPALVAALGLVAGPAVATPTADRPVGTTAVFVHVQRPGFPAYAFRHRNGRVYAGTYTNSAGDHERSRIFEWSNAGALLRSWTMPHQDLSQEHGVQVANQDRHGRLILLEKSTSSIWTLNVQNGRFRRWATLPDLPICSTGAQPCSPNADDLPAIPNYAAWGPGGALYVTDYGQAVIWRLPHRTHRPHRWFASSQLDGSQFGTTGIVYRRHRHDLLIGQGSTAVDASVPADGKLYRLPIRATHRPGTLSTLWTSQPGDLPDGFGLASSGHVYVALAGLANQVVELGARGQEKRRFGTRGSGDNGSSIPFDTPSSATFQGTRVLVANQSFTGDATHHAILWVEVGERGQPPYLPRTALWHH